MGLKMRYAAYANGLVDFWGRRANRPRYSREFSLFDHRINVSSNHKGVLMAVDHCQPLYSTAPVIDAPPFVVELVVDAVPIDPGPPPDGLFDHIQYTGYADWLMLRLGAWGHCHVDLVAGKAVAVLTPPLSERPDIVARCLLNTVFTNFFIANGYAMLHASCLVREGWALLLMAPHNSGKSTTALRLALAGYTLLSDSMVFLPPPPKVQLFGFPVGKVKLRQDVLPEFPELSTWLIPEQVRNETKYSLDLRQIDPAMVYPKALVPSRIDLCLLARGDKNLVTPASKLTVNAAVISNSLFYDTEQVWNRNLNTVLRQIDHMGLHQLAIGPKGETIEATIDELWERRSR